MATNTRAGNPHVATQHTSTRADFPFVELNTLGFECASILNVDFLPWDSGKIPAHLKSTIMDCVRKRSADNSLVEPRLPPRLLYESRLAGENVQTKQDRVEIDAVLDTKQVPTGEIGKV
jgi:hypothetical protein